MKRQRRAHHQTSSSVRQSVTIPAQLAIEVEFTMSRALVVLAQRGVDAEAAAHDNLKTSLATVASWQRPIPQKDEAGKDLIRAIFGKDSIAVRVI